MTTNPFFSGRIPQGLYHRIEEYRKETDESKTDVLIKALAKYVEYELEEDQPNIPPIQKTFDEIFQRLDLIEQELSTLAHKEKKQDTEQLTKTPDNKTITTDNKQLESPDKKAITTDNKPLGYSDNFVITNDNSQSSQILSTREVLELVEISQSTLSSWKRQGKLPNTCGKYEIDFDHSETKPRNSFWKVRLIDNNKI